MNKHKPTNRTLHFIAYTGDDIQVVGITPVGLQTVSGQEDFISAESEQGLMASAHDEGLDFTDWKPLPDEGVEVLAGEVYSFGDELVVCRQTHDRTADDPSAIPALFSTYRDGEGTLDWIANENVSIGTQRMYNGTQYNCIQSHQTLSTWTPDVTPALWTVKSFDGLWVAGEAVEVGDIRTHLEIDYKCLQAHTTQAGWEPPNTPALWEVI